MRTGDETGRAHAADEISLVNARAGGDGDDRQVQVLGLKAVRVPQVHHPTRVAHPGADHRRHTADRRLRGRLVVDAKMRALLESTGVAGFAKPR